MCDELLVCWYWKDVGIEIRTVFIRVRLGEDVWNIIGDSLHFSTSHCKTLIFLKDCTNWMNADIYLNSLALRIYLHCLG